MGEEGVMNSIKEGGTTGAAIGFAVGATRAFLESKEFAQKSDAITAAAKKSKPNLSPAALRALRPSPLPALAMTTAIYGGLGAVYMGVENISENVRDKKDMWNGVIGALVAGSLVGIRSGSMYVSGGAMAALAAMSATVDIFDGQFGPMDDSMLERRRALYRE